MRGIVLYRTAIYRVYSIARSNITAMIWWNVRRRTFAHALTTPLPELCTILSGNIKYIQVQPAWAGYNAVQHNIIVNTAQQSPYQNTCIHILELTVAKDTPYLWGASYGVFTVRIGRVITAPRERRSVLFKWRDLIWNMGTLPPPHPTISHIAESLFC